MPFTRVHRSTLPKYRPGPLLGPAMADLLKARYAYTFGAGRAPELYLVHDGAGWDGTFGFVLRRILDDVLNADPAADPWPVSAIVDAARGTLETVAGHAAGFDEDADEVVLGDGSTVAVDRILAIAV